MHAVMDGGAGHLVVSQPFEIGKHDNPFLQQLIEVPLPTTTMAPKWNNSTINLTDGLVNPGSFYTYQGSLTTPPCSENVTWVVLKNPASMSEEQYQAFRTIMGNNFLRDEVQWLKYDVRSPIPVGCLQLAANITVRGQRQSLLRHRRAADVPAKPFQFVALVRLGRYPSVQRESRFLRYSV